MLDAAISLKDKGYRIYLGTNQESYRAKYMWERLGFNKVFEDIFASCYVGFEKPNMEYYEQVQGQLSLSPEQILFLDDSQKNIDSAIKQGWEAFLHANYEETNQKIFQFL